MKTLLFITTAFFATATLAYAAQSAYPGEALYIVKVGVNENVDSIVALDTAAEAEVQAEIFAERLEEIDRITDDVQIDSKMADAMQKEVGRQFALAFELIQEVEDENDSAEAAVARAIMQSAIDYHMQNSHIATDYLTDDLMVYSKILTESLIANAAKA